MYCKNVKIAFNSIQLQFKNVLFQKFLSLTTFIMNIERVLAKTVLSWYIFTWNIGQYEVTCLNSAVTVPPPGQ